jgi:uridine phosphorylase
MYQPSELILTPDHKLYHLRINGEDIADHVLLTGDPQRVFLITRHFDTREAPIVNREFITQTGTYRNTRITVVGTGIGTDNIDIVLNELDAAVNVDLFTRTEKIEKRSLKIIRLGTCGALQESIPAGAVICSSHGLGFDGLLNFYADAPTVCDEAISQAFLKHCSWPHRLPFPYCVAADGELLKRFSDSTHTGITATAPGFYAPQGREIRLKAALTDLSSQLAAFQYQQSQILNFEMETSALYGLARLLGHRPLTLCTVIANRRRGEFLEDYQSAIEQLIHLTLNKITELQ